MVPLASVNLAYTYVDDLMPWSARKFGRLGGQGNNARAGAAEAAAPSEQLM